MADSPLHPSIVAMVSLAANIAANHPKNGLCQLERLRGFGIAEEQIDMVVDIARHIRDEAGQMQDHAFDEEARLASAAVARRQRRLLRPNPPRSPAAHRPPREIPAAEILETCMKTIKVLGTGCANCNNTLKLIEEVARAKGAQVQLEKVEDLQQIMIHGVMSTPGVVIDGKVVHAGGVPSRASVESWF